MKLNMNLKFLWGALIALVAMCGCSTKEELGTRGEIRLGVVASTRASIGSVIDLAQYAGSNIGIFGVKTAAHTSEAGADWTDAEFSESTPEAAGLIMNNVQTSGVDPDGTIHWADKYFYPLDENSGVKFCAYHPYSAVSIAAPAAGQAPVASFTLTGAEDLMFATPTVGWRTKTEATNLAFKHVLTQLTFELSDSGSDYFVGKKLTAIKVKDANTTGKMNIETGDIAEWGTPVELSVGGIGAEGVEITEAAKNGGQAVGSEIMLQPGLASFAVSVTIDGKEYPKITIKPQGEDTFAAGKSYKITLIFKEKVPIGVSASVVPWEEGGTGSGVVI